MATYGYVRVSTQEQNERRQVVSMQAAGVAPENVYMEKASGKSMDRPMWEALMEALQDGDTLVVDELSRMGRTYDGVTEAWRELRKRGVSIRVLDAEFLCTEHMDAMGDMGRAVEDMLLALMAYVADHERREILRRQAEGIAVARQQGKYRGRRPNEVPQDMAAEAARRLHDGDSMASVARYLGVHRNTLAKMVRDGRVAA